VVTTGVSVSAFESKMIAPPTKITNGRLTKRMVDAASPKSERYVVWDSELKGFGLRVEPSGAKTFLVRYRPKGAGRIGTKRFLTVGRYGIVSPDEARNQAKAILGAVAGGGDPAGEKNKAREAITMAALAERYLDEEATPKLKPGTAKLYSHYLRDLAIPEIGRLKADAITRSEISKLHLKIGRTRPVAANRVLATLSALFSFGAKQSMLPDGFNPARGIDKFREAARERFLTVAELERLGAAINEAETTGVPWVVDGAKPTAKHTPKTERITQMSPFAGAAIRLLLFTGCRLREILHLRWCDVDIERGMLNLLDSKTGRKSVILNTPALAVIGTLPRLGDYVIHGERPDKPRSDLKRPWAVVCRRAGLEGVRIHDLRHSFASVGIGAGHGLPIVGKLLGHADASSTARYAHLDADPVRRASNSIAAAIEAALSGKSCEMAATKNAPK
jgi:integrase